MNLFHGKDGWWVITYRVGDILTTVRVLKDVPVIETAETVLAYAAKALPGVTWQQAGPTHFTEAVAA